MPHARDRSIIDDEKARWRVEEQATERITVAAAANDRSGQLTVSRPQLLVFAAVLTATALTGAAAVAGLKRSVPAVPTAPRVGQTITPVTPAPPRRVEPGD
jgi:hypothetical protein